MNHIQILLLGGTSALSEKIKASLCKSFGPKLIVTQITDGQVVPTGEASSRVVMVDMECLVSLNDRVMSRLNAGRFSLHVEAEMQRVSTQLGSPEDLHKQKVDARAKLCGVRRDGIPGRAPKLLRKTSSRRGK